MVEERTEGSENRQAGVRPGHNVILRRSHKDGEPCIGTPCLICMRNVVRSPVSFTGDGYLIDSDEMLFTVEGRRIEISAI